MADEENGEGKAHRPKHSGPKAEKKKKKSEGKDDSRRNAKAFTFHSVVKAAKQFRRSKDIETKKHHVPVVDRTPLEPPPVIVAVVGPPKVGKTTLINSLLKNFTRQNLSNIEGPVTLVSGKKRRLTFIECGNDINSMIDIAKIADLVLLLIDASFGFEMEVFEFLNICQVHGFPKIIGVLTHLDMLKNNKSLKKIKKKLKDRFWTEVYQGAKLFYLSGLVHGSYPKVEVHNLGRFISVMKFRPLTWRTAHPYILADRMEDLTDPESIRQNAKCDRRVSLYGYVRGAHLKYNSKVHLLGCGDFVLDDVSLLKDPCPLPDKEKKRSLNERERMVYAPMSGVGGIVYDKDAVYIDLGGSHSTKAQTDLSTEEEQEDNRPGNELVSSLIDAKHTLDSKMASSQMTLFKDGISVSMQEVIADSNGKPSQQIVQSEDGRIRRKAVFEDNEEGEENDSSDDDMDDEEEENKLVDYNNVKYSGNKEEKEDEDREDDDDDDDDDEVDISASDSGENSVEVLQNKKKQGLKRKMVDEDETDSEDPSEEEDTNKVKDVSKSKQKRIVKDDGLENGDVNTKRKKKTKRKMKVESDVSEELETELRNREKKKSKEISKKERKLQRDKSSESTFDVRDVGDCEVSFKNRKDNETKDKIEEESDSESSEDSSDDDGVIQMDDDDYSDDDDDDDGGYSSNSDHETSENEIDFPTDVERGQFKWKDSILKKASDSFYKHQLTTPNLRKLVYGNVVQDTTTEDHADSDDEETVGGFFKVKSKNHKMDTIMHKRDCSLDTGLSGMDWDLEEVRDNIKDCFVTGKWAEDEDAEKLLSQDDQLSDDEIFGDFEDLETGEIHSVSHKAARGTKSDEHESENSDDNNKDDKEGEKQVSRMEKKKKLKAAFNAHYDEGDEVSFYEELKTQMNEQSQLNQREFEDMDDESRVQYEGFRPGMYVRIELKNMPCEFVTNFDARYPIILGGVLSNEDNVGYIQVRVKKHRWFKRILKTRDPLILSIGWRRFQSIVMYSMQDHNGRHRLLKYTPEHLHCTATMYGPIAPPTTGVLAVQSVAGATSDFRISATGTVLALDKTVELVKKLKLTGTPYKIYKNTAFIKGMFNSALEVAKFEGASIRSVSGIRGQIKRALKSPEGGFRATFEDKLLISDIVFVRTWYPVRIPKFYNLVTSLLLPNEAKVAWKGMKTVGQMRKEEGTKPAVKQDSIYKPIERQTRRFNPLVIPDKLQKDLPFKSKPKNPKKRTKKTLEAKRAVVMEPDEKKVYTLMQQLYTANKEKIRKRKEKMEEKRKIHRAEMAKIDTKRQQKRKEERKKVFRMMAQAEKRKQRS